MNLLEFDSIKYEIFINDDWLDITSDVEVEPEPEFSRGIMGNSPTDRVAQTGYFTFSLKNSVANSAGLNGYYSPGHSNCLSGWTSGLRVRLTFVFENIPFVKWYGRIKPDGIVVEPGQYLDRKVHVTCVDMMYRAQMHELDKLIFGEDKDIGYIVRNVIENMPIQPLMTEIAVGLETFPTVFDMVYLRTTALAEFNKAAMSELSFIYVRGDRTGGETLVVENRATRVLKGLTDLILPSAECTVYIQAEDGSDLQDEDGVAILMEASQSAVFDNSIVGGMKPRFGATFANRINSYVYPREVVVDATLFTLHQTFYIAPGETVTDMRVSYLDPDNPKVQISAINVDPLVRTTNYTATANEDGTGADMDSYLTITGELGTESAILTAKNTHASTGLWVQTIEITGDAVYTYNSIQSVRNNTASQKNHGVIPISLDHKYLSDVKKAQLFSDYYLGREGNPRVTIDRLPMIANLDSLRLMGFLQLEPGEKATFIEEQSGINGDYFIMGYQARIFQGKYVRWSPVLSDDLGYSVTYTGVVGEDSYINAALTYIPDQNTSIILNGSSSVGLIKFDLSSIPSTAVLIDAKLYMTVKYFPPFPADRTINVYRVLKTMEPSEATWWLASTGVSWSTPGAGGVTDKDSSSIGSFVITGGSDAPFVITLDNDAITDMIDGTLTNNGFVLVDSSYIDLHSLESSNPAKRPRLVIRYRE